MENDNVATASSEAVYKCVCVREPLDYGRKAEDPFCPHCAESRGALPDPSALQMKINVQLESIINSSALLQQLKQELDKALDRLVLLHDQELELRQVELACHQFTQQEIHNMIQNARNSAGQLERPAIQEACNEAEASTAAAPAAGGRKWSQSPQLSRSVPPEALEKQEVRVIEWDPATQHAPLSQEQINAERNLPASGSMTFLYTY